MNRPAVAYRRGGSGDIAEILRIQKANLISNLSKADRGDGFLSVEFSPQQLEEMNREIPIVVADVGSQLGGYLCGSSLGPARQVPLLSHIIDLFPETRFRDRSLNQYRSFIYGPICVDKPLRGQGVVQGLYTELLRQLDSSFDVGVLFISHNNPRSLYAHVDKLGMEKVGDFEFNDSGFSLLAFGVPSS